MARIYVPRDATALALGAHEVALALTAALRQRGLAAEIVRTGTRGAFWMEPLVEVDTPAGRVGYANVTPEQVPGLLEAGLLEGEPHAACIGLVEQHPWFAGQQRVTYARCGITDPLSLTDYAAHGKNFPKDFAAGARALAGHEVVQRDGAGGRFEMKITPAAASGTFALSALALCRGLATCEVVARHEGGRALAFRYHRAAGGGETAQWDCKASPRPNASQCL